MFNLTRQTMSTSKLSYLPREKERELFGWGKLKKKIDRAQSSMD